MLGNNTIKYISDTQHLNIICIISYFDIFPFFQHYFHYNICAIILISLHRTTGPSRCLFIDIYNTFVVLTTNKPRLFTVVILLHRILRQQYGRMLRLGGWGGGEGGRCGFFLSITSSCALRDPRRYRKTGCGRCEEEISAQRAREKGGRGMGSAPVSPSLARRTPKTSLVREREIEDSVGLPSGCGWMGSLGQDRRTI